jgi:large subunit ribosomal protein L15
MIDDGKIKGTSLDLKLFLKNKILKDKNSPLKILGNGELKTKIAVSANAFSKTAKDKIENLGGEAIIV